ncbi:unnamed protein product [Vicia faba]|uniref:Uncharacterized protein n=1 Tax=Vicia faba TaxID=3906 RepID=A0AAV1ASX7_VICFA|nr:unnamed protein product [Vicia faba]
MYTMLQILVLSPVHEDFCYKPSEYQKNSGCELQRATHFYQREDIHRPKDNPKTTVEVRAYLPEKDRRIFDLALVMMRMMNITLKIDAFLRDRRLKVPLQLKIEVCGFTEDDRDINNEKWRTDLEALREVQ